MPKKKLTIEHVMRQRPVPLKLYSALPRVGVVVLLGFRGEGKTATAMRIMEDYHSKYGYGGAVLYFPRRLKSKLPAWVKLVDDMEKLPANLKRGDLFWFTAHMYAYRFIGRGRVYMTVDRTENGSRRRVHRHSNAVPTLMSRSPMPGQKVGSY